MKSFVWIAMGFLLLVGNCVVAQPHSPVLEKVRAAQSKNKPYAAQGIFSRLGNPDPSMQAVLQRGSLLRLDKTMLSQLKNQKPEFLVMDIPFEEGKILTMELVKNDVLAPEFKVSTSGSLQGQSVDRNNGVYYQGVVRGNARSLAAISVVGDEVIGVIDVDGIGNMILGAMENDAQGRYAFYRTEDLKHDMEVGCDTKDIPAAVTQTAEQITLNAFDPNKCVKIYFECEYDMYVTRGSSVQSTIDFMTGIYNVVKTLYDNESVNTAISEIFVWNTPDNYPTTSTADALYAFQAARGTNFNGNLAHLVSRGAPASGGVAFLDVSCSKSNAFAYSYIQSSYSNFPTYSWTVNVIAHEMGHNLGSSHTHACVWDVDGDGTAREMIDGCGPSKGYSEGSCTVAPLPTNGGTVMSYCHLVSGVGINWNNGFGKLPGDRIRSRVYNATCMDVCNTCTTTVSITSTQVSCNGGRDGSATATGSGSTGGYTYLWSNGATTATITGLAAGTYSVTVKGENGAGCAVIGTVTISQPAALSPAGNVTPESVPGAANGAIDLSVSGGTLPYTYQWSNGSISQDISNLTGGTYTVVVRDSRGCTAERSFTVSSNGCAQQLTSFPVAEGFESGLGIFTQAVNDTYNWTRQTGTTPNSRTGPSGAYEGAWYMFAQGKGNTGEAALESPCLAIADVQSPAIQFAYSMNGNTIGTLRLEVSINNGSTWTILWSRTGKQGTNWLTASVPLDNYKTAYTKIRFVATPGGSTGDIAIDGIQFTGQQTSNCTSPTLSFSKTDVTCFGASNGSATVTATGGSLPYAYAWSNGATTASISNLAAGTYNVTVSTQGGCTASGSVTIGQPAQIQLQTTVTPVSAPGASDGSVALSVSNGNGPFAYQWSNGANTKDISNVPAGVYTVLVSDAVNCNAQKSATVTEPLVCTAGITLPYSESFETGLGQWKQATQDQFDWRRLSGNTPTTNTGPTTAYQGGYYLYTEANDASSGARAIIESACLDLKDINQGEISFAWHMLGNQMGSLALDITLDDGATWNTLWGRSGNFGSNWVVQKVSLAAYSGKVVRLRFTGTLGGGARGDMAIDDIRINNLGAAVQFTSGEIPEPSFDFRRVYPNPTTGAIQLEVYSANNSMANVSLLDVTGRAEDMGKVALTPGLNTIRLQLPERKQGMYLIKLMENGRVITRPIMIVK